MRILWAVDGSTAAATAGAALAARWRASGHLLALAVVPHDPLPWLLARGLGVGRAIDDERAADLRAALQDGVRSLHWPLERAETRLAEGKVGQLITDTAREWHADLIVLGGRASEAGSGPVGPTAAAVLVHAPCPVLIAQAPDPWNVVLLATDGSPTARAAETTAMTLLPGDALVHVRGVVADKVPLGARRAGRELFEEELRARAFVDAAADRISASGRSVTRATATGRPAPEIVRLAAELNVDLIVLGTHGQTGWRRAVIGSVAGEVAHAAPVSVLIVPPQAELAAP